jgi:hypothetical protein
MKDRAMIAFDCQIGRHVIGLGRPDPPRMFPPTAKLSLDQHRPAFKLSSAVPVVQLSLSPSPG